MAVHPKSEIPFKQYKEVEIDTEKEWKSYKTYYNQQQMKV